jgi:hypothetical protein
MRFFIDWHMGTIIAVGIGIDYEGKEILIMLPFVAVSIKWRWR